MVDDQADAVLNRLRGQAAKKLGRIFECTRLLDLNRSDADFRGRADGPAQRGWTADGKPLAAVRSPGEILYVVDTNFIQAFLQPMIWLRASRLFHDPKVWTASDKEAAWSGAQPDHAKGPFGQLCELVGAQATMLATELVLREAFRSPAGKIYMSLDHQAELVRQVKILGASFGAVSKDGVPNQRDGKSGPKTPLQDYKAYILTTRANIVELGKLRDAPRGVVEAEMKKDSLFISDSVRVTSLSDRDFEALKRNYINARLCRILAEDDLIEPGMQIRRLQSDDFWERMDTIEWAFPKPSAEEVAELERQRDNWHERLQARLEAEDSRRTNANPPPTRSPKAFLGRVIPRSKESVRADARTLAYLIWAAKRAGPTRRIVFVTGDSLLIDAYRDWYSRQTDGQSFLLRPLAQYAPQYNQQDADGMLASEMRIFEQTRQVLEASTYPMTLALRGHYFNVREDWHSRLSGARARDRFCIEAASGVVDPSLMDELIPMANNIPSLRNSLQHMDGMADSLRWLERLSIGAVPDLVRSRAEAAERAASELAAVLGTLEGGVAPDAQGVIEKWLQQQLDTALNEGFRFSLTVAVQNILNQINSGEYQTPARAKVLLRLKFPHNGEFLSAPDWLVALRDGAEVDRRHALGELTKRPEMVFALAGWLTFRSQLWSDAVRFADFACRASEVALSRGEASPAHLECQYLKAVSLRVRMMSDAPDPALHDSDLWRRDLVGAEAALQACIEEHSARNEQLLLTRAHSERAALRFTYCAWAAVGNLSSLQTYQDERLVLEDTFRDGVRDLVTVISKLPALKIELEGASAGDPDRISLSWIELQARVNPECARLVYEKLTTTIDKFRGEYRMRGAPGLESVLESIRWPDEAPEGEENKVMHAYALSARLRKGEVVSSVIIEQVLKEAMDSVSLALDRAMLEAISGRLVKKSVNSD